MENWKTDPAYCALVQILKNAGIKIVYQEVPDDGIDGPIWARADSDGKIIMMPDSSDAFQDAETACVILGHEAGHILSELDSPDEPAERRKNEAVCDLIGFYLYRLALLTVENEIKKAWDKEIIG